MAYELLIIIGLTLLPFLELRASIPYGILTTDYHWSIVLLIAVITNAILGPVIYVLLDKFIHLAFVYEPIKKLYHRTVDKAQMKIHKFVEKYGEFGVALFIGVPLPGSGSYSGALGSYILGLGLRKFAIANVIGVIIAGVAVTAVVLSGSGLFEVFVKVI